MQPTLFQLAHHRQWCIVTPYPLQWILAAVIHGSGGCHGGGVEGLDLVGTKFVALEPERQVDHVLIPGARMCGDEVGDQILFLAGLLGVGVKQGLEAIVGSDAGFHHVTKGPVLGMFRGYLQVSAHVVGDQFFYVFGGLHREVVAQPGSD